MPDIGGDRWARRLLRLLLVLYPPSFRRALGDDLIETSLRHRRSVRGDGLAGTLGFCLGDGLRFALDGLLERFAELGRFARDARGGLRQIRRAPGFHLLALSTIALGIGASTAMFTVADAVVFRSLPYPRADDLTVLFSRFDDLEFSTNSLANFADLQEATDAFDWMAAVRDRSPTLIGGDEPEPERVFVLDVTAGYLQGLGGRVALGRSLLATDHRPDASPVAVVAWRQWQERWGGDPDVLGSTVDLDGVQHLVVGVLGPGFRDPAPIEASAPTSAWIPVRAGEEGSNRDDYSYTVLARRAPGVSPEVASAEARRVGQALGEAHPEANRVGSARLSLVPYSLTTVTVEDTERVRVLALLGAAAVLLILACVNVANLLLARGDSRVAELAVRQALGATRSRIALQLLVESLVLSALGGVLGLGFGWWVVRSFRALAPGEVPRLHEVGLDLRAVLFVGAVSLLTGAAFGVLPALRGSRASGEGRATAGRRGVRTQWILVGVQMALALVLVSGTALLLGSFRELLRTDPGFDPDDLLVVEVRPPRESEREAQQVFYERLLEQTRALAGVEHAALSFTVPARAGAARGRVTTRGGAVDETSKSFYRFNPVVGDLFATLHQPVLAGRVSGDRVKASDPPVVVLNQTAARELFPGVDPVGLQLAIGGSEATFREVIGVVGDARQQGPAFEPEPEIYVPYTQQPVPRLLLTLRTEPGLEPPVDTVRGLIGELAPSTPIDDVQTMSGLVAGVLAEQKFLTALVSFFGALALLIAVVGTYSTASCAASRRRRELGIRQALGAGRPRLLADSLLRSARVAIVGVAAGLSLTWVVAKGFEGALFGIARVEGAAVGIACLLLVVAALCASAIPSVRALHTDPMEVLRSE